MPNINEAIPLWFVFATIAGILAATGLGIWAVMIKKRKMQSTSNDTKDA